MRSDSTRMPRRTVTRPKSPQLSCASLGRRDFLTRSSAAVLGAGLCSGCAVFASRIQPDAQLGVNNGVMVLDHALSKQLSEPGSSVRVVTPDEAIRVIVFRTAAGRLAATDMACTHWGSDVHFDAPTQRLVCSSHGSEFDARGTVVEGPADEPLKAYSVEEVDGVVRLILAA